MDRVLDINIQANSSAFAIPDLNLDTGRIIDIKVINIDGIDAIKSSNDQTLDVFLLEGRDYSVIKNGSGTVIMLNPVDCDISLEVTYFVGEG